MRQSADKLRIDVVGTGSHPQDGVTVLYHYYITIDPTTSIITYHKADGQVLPAGFALDIATVVYNLNDCAIWDTKLVNGTLECVFAVFPNVTADSQPPTSHSADYEVHEYWIATFNAVADTWSYEKICDAGTTFAPDWLYAVDRNNPAVDNEFCFSGGICLDQNNSGTVYLSREYGVGDFRLEKWVKGATWTKSADISGNIGGVNARPMQSVGGSTLFYWGGTYTTYNDYTTDVYALDTKTLNTLGNGASSGNGGTSTSVMSSEMLSGSQQCQASSDGNGEDYASVADPTSNDGVAIGVVAGSSLAAPANTSAAQRAALLAAVMHEMGPVLAPALCRWTISERSGRQDFLVASSTAPKGSFSMPSCASANTKAPRTVPIIRCVWSP